MNRKTFKRIRFAMMMVATMAIALRLLAPEPANEPGSHTEVRPDDSWWSEPAGSH